MFCTKCGKEIKEGAKFCVYCGETVQVLTTKTEVGVIQKDENLSKNAIPESFETPEKELLKKKLDNALESKEETCLEDWDVLEPIQTTITNEDVNTNGKKKMQLALLVLCIVIVIGAIVGLIFMSQSLSQRNKKTEPEMNVVKENKNQSKENKQKVDELVKTIETMDKSYATAFDMSKLTEYEKLVQENIQKGDYQNALDVAKQWEEYTNALSEEKTGLSSGQVSMDASNFPMIYVCFDVEDKDGNVVNNLTADNIIVWEYVNDTDKKKVEDFSISVDSSGIAYYRLAFKTSYRNTEDEVRYHIYMDNADAGDSITGGDIYEADVFRSILNEFLNAYVDLVNTKDYSCIKDYIYTEETAKEGYGMEKEMKAQTNNENLLSEYLKEGVVKELIWVDDKTCRIRSNEIYDAVYMKTTKSIRNDKNSNAWDMLCERYGGNPFEYEDEMEPEELERIQEIEWEVSATVYQNCLYELKWSEGEGWKFFRFVEGVSQQQDVYNVY